MRQSASRCDKFIQRGMKISLHTLLFLLLCGLLVACNAKNNVPATEVINEMKLRQGEIISCGPPHKEFGFVDFEMSCDASSKNDFNIAVSLLHSFEYDEAEKIFAKVINENPGCVMAYWGVAMCNFHALWDPPTEPELQKGSKAIEIAKSIKGKTERETAYINALATFYNDWLNSDHRSRSVAYEKAMYMLHSDYPNDKEAAVFYALALNASAAVTDKTYSNQKKAAAILNGLYPGETDHPGIIHYLIHTYDYPALAELALPAARKYAGIAPSSAHALHMPSHIFTRLGLWDECISSNLRSVASAKCYAEQSGIKGHWDEELHGIDYLVYAYLQKGQNDSAKALIKYLETFTLVEPFNFKVAYAFAASPSRYVLENKNWNAASSLVINPTNVPWNKYPWQEAIVYFTRLMGAAHGKNITAAASSLQKLLKIRDTLLNQNDLYKAGQVAVQIKTGEAWIAFAAGHSEKALRLMKQAADMEDSTGKHPVTPGEVLPARELLGDMYFSLKKYREALLHYKSALEKSPNRFNSLYGAASAAAGVGDVKAAQLYYTKLINNSVQGSYQRAELMSADTYLKKHKSLMAQKRVDGGGQWTGR